MKYYRTVRSNIKIAGLTDGYFNEFMYGYVIRLH